MVDLEIREKLISFFENKEKILDFIIDIHESISLNKENFDRHFTTFNNFKFKVTQFGIRTSGAKLFFYGENSSYEIHLDCVQYFHQNKFDQIVFIEILSENVYRRSVLNFSK